MQAGADIPIFVFWGFSRIVWVVRMVDVMVEEAFAGLCPAVENLEVDVYRVNVCENRLKQAAEVKDAEGKSEEVVAPILPR